MLGSVLNSKRKSARKEAGQAPSPPKGEDMPEAPTTEPWAGTAPVPHAFRPGAKPEVYMSKIAEGDERLWVPIGRPHVEDVFSKPAWRSEERRVGDGHSCTWWRM